MLPVSRHLRNVCFSSEFERCGFAMKFGPVGLAMFLRIICFKVLLSLAPSVGDQEEYYASDCGRTGHCANSGSRNATLGNIVAR